MYEKMIQAAVENEADAVVSAYIEERDAGSIRRCMNIKSGVYEKLRLEGMKKKLIYSGGGGYHEFGINPALWNKIFRTEMIKRACRQASTEIRRSSDAAVSFPVIFRSEKTVVLNEFCPYHYRIHDASLGSWRDHKYFYRINILLDQLGKLDRDTGQKFEIYNQLRHYALLLTVLGMSGNYPDKSLKRLPQIWRDTDYAKTVIRKYDLVSLSNQYLMNTDDFLTLTRIKEMRMIAKDRKICFIIHGYAEKINQLLKNRIT